MPVYDITPEPKKISRVRICGAKGGELRIHGFVLERITVNDFMFDFGAQLRRIREIKRIIWEPNLCASDTFLMIANGLDGARWDDPRWNYLCAGRIESIVVVSVGAPVVEYTEYVE